MLKKISDSQTLVIVGMGMFQKKYIVDSTENTVSRSNISMEEATALEDALPDGLAATVENALVLCPNRVNEPNELALLAGHLDHLALAFES